jgi:hypothetical protein
MQYELLLLTASLKKTMQTLKSKKSEVGMSYVRYTGNISVFGQIKSPAIALDPGTVHLKE